MSLQQTLQSITSRPESQPTLPVSEVTALADDARNILAAMLFRPAADVRRMIDIFAPIAESFLQELISGKYPEASLALRAKYASLALARAGYGPIHNIKSIHATLTREDIEAIKDRAIKYAGNPALRHEPIPLHVQGPPLSNDGTNTSINPTSSEQNQ